MNKLESTAKVFDTIANQKTGDQKIYFHTKIDKSRPIIDKFNKKGGLQDVTEFISSKILSDTKSLDIKDLDKYARGYKKIIDSAEMKYNNMNMIKWVFYKILVTLYIQNDYAETIETAKSNLLSLENHHKLKIEKEDKLNSGKFTTIDLASRGGNNNKITANIANCNDLKLTDKDLPEIFERANKNTLNQPYPCFSTNVIKINGENIYRPNHNGTHSARQVRLLETLIDLCEKSEIDLCEKSDGKITFTQDEKLNLKLAAYFIRAGRVDESSHNSSNPDNNISKRSAQLYSAYAKQLNVDPDIIEWVKLIMMNALKPRNQTEGIEDDSKERMALDLLNSSHELDLVRCKKKTDHDENIKKIKTRLESYGIDKNNVDNLHGYSIELCKATGNKIQYTDNKGDNSLFGPLSLSGKLCREKLQEIKFSS
jgi:hypothetical protein